MSANGFFSGIFPANASIATSTSFVPTGQTVGLQRFRGLEKKGSGGGLPLPLPLLLSNETKKALSCS